MLLVRKNTIRIWLIFWHLDYWTFRNWLVGLDMLPLPRLEVICRQIEATPLTIFPPIIYILHRYRVTSIARLPSRLTSFWIISSQIFSFLKFPLVFSISSQRGWQTGTIDVNLSDSDANVQKVWKTRRMKRNQIKSDFHLAMWTHLRRIGAQLRNGLEAYRR